MRYRKKPVEVEAVQWHGQELASMCVNRGDKQTIMRSSDGDTVSVPAGEGVLVLAMGSASAVRRGDWILSLDGVTVDVIPDHIFTATYEPVESSGATGTPLRCRRCGSTDWSAQWVGNPAYRCTKCGNYIDVGEVLAAEPVEGE